ncbi:MAG: hypothetical protein QHH26_03145 [Armatimonadota bacterium]|nr:hypothetical protein [Armatimonadota bacterium]
MYRRILLQFLTPVILAFVGALPVSAWKVIDAHWRPDANPWAKAQVWEGTIWSEGWSEEEQFYPKHMKPSGSVHVILRNDSQIKDTIWLSKINDISIDKLVTNSQNAGNVIWYKVESPKLTAPNESYWKDDKNWAQPKPVEVEGGGWVECIVRFRTTPKGIVRLQFITGSNGIVEVPVSIKAQRARIESISFSPKIDKLYVYIRSLDGNAIRTGVVRLDGHKVSARWTEGPKSSGLLLAEIDLKLSWEYGSYHLIEVEIPGELQLVQPVRAWDNYFCIGLYGVLDAGSISDAKAHGINTYFTSGVSPLLDEAGLNCVPAYNVGEGRPRNENQSGVLFYQNKDEPDAHDFSSGENLPVMDRLGVNAQAEVLPRLSYQKARDPRTPNLLLVNNTYKPLNWYVYGQIADIYCTDPYVPLNGRQLDYVWRALDCARDACTPRPLVSVLWACGLAGARKFGHRPPTPQEERMMVFYALGCGVKGIAYFIDLTSETGEGKFTGLSDIKPLWEEVGRTNKDVQALAKFLSIGCPIPISISGKDVWARALQCGRDNLVVIVVNTNHYIGFETRNEYAWHTPAKNVELTISLPPHFRNCHLEEVKGGKFVPLSFEKLRGAIKFRLDILDDARAFVITNG